MMGWLELSEILLVNATVIVGSLMLFTLMGLLKTRHGAAVRLLIATITVLFSLSSLLAILPAPHEPASEALQWWSRLLMLLGFLYLAGSGPILCMGRFWRDGNGGTNPRRAEDKGSP